MKIFTLIIASLVLTLTLTAEEKNKGAHLFILSGQSNMKKLNPAVSFTPTVEKEFGKDKVIVVKDAESGQSIQRWYKKWSHNGSKKTDKVGDLYDRLMKKVNEAIKGQKITSVTFVWMQGESDSKGSRSSVYEESLNGLIKQVKTDLKVDSLNVVIGRISDWGISKRKSWVKIRESHVKVAESLPNGTWVDTDDLNDLKSKDGSVKNDLHYSPEGFRILGQRFAEKAIELIKKGKAK